MEPITQIAKLKRHRIFRAFTWPNTLTDFPSKVLIYGWNGSGKTTLSNLLRQLEKKSNITEGEVAFTIGGQVLQGTSIETSTIPKIRVFNRNFIEENVFPTGGGDLTPIYILGEENVEKQQRLEELKVLVATKQAELTQEIANKSRAVNEAERISTTTANEIIKPALRSAGNNSYNNYNKTGFERRYHAFIASGGDISASILSEEALSTHIQRLTTNEKPSIPLVTYTPPDITALNELVSRLVRETVTSSIIARLQDNASLSSWVEQGLALTKEQGSANCLFCEQPLPTETLATLDAHFNDAYQVFIGEINTSIQQVDLALSSINTARNSFPDNARLYEHLQPSYNQARDEATTDLGIVEEWLNECKAALVSKKAAPFQALSFTETVPTVKWQGMTDINILISQHNQETDEFAQSLNEVRRTIETHYVALRFNEYQAANSVLTSMKPLYKLLVRLC